MGVQGLFMTVSLAPVPPEVRKEARVPAQARSVYCVAWDLPCPLWVSASSEVGRLFLGLSQP